MAEKENQHTVSKFLLRQFTPDVGDKVLWQFSKADYSRALRKSPEKAATESYFYSVQRADGTWDHSTEDALSKAEDHAARSFRRLICDCHAVREDRLIISNFIGLMYLRPKAMREHAIAEAAKLSTPEGTVSFIERDFEHYVRRYGEPAVRAFIARVKETGKGVALKENFHLDRLFDRAAAWGAIIRKMSWTVCKAKPPHFFLISDNPAFTRSTLDPFTPGIVGLLRRDLGAELGFPFSSRRYLIGRTVRPQARKCGGRTPGDCKSQWCDKTRIRELNVRTVLSAYEDVFAPENCPDIRALVEKHRDFRLMHPQV